MVNDSTSFDQACAIRPTGRRGERLLSGDNEEVIVVMTCHIMAHVGLQTGVLFVSFNVKS
jgi:hypothetical protein